MSETSEMQLERVTMKELVEAGQFQGALQPSVQMRSFKELQVMASHVAAAGILGTDSEAQVLTLMLLSQAEGRDAMTCKSRWYIWEQGGKVMTQRSSKSILADFHRAGGQSEIITDSDAVVTVRFTYRGRTVTVTWDEARVKAAGLAGKTIHRGYPAQMKFHRCVAEGVAKIAPEVIEGAVAVNETVIDPDEIPEATPKPYRSDPRPANNLAIINAVRKAASANKNSWKDGESFNFAPAWEWMSILFGRPVNGGEDVGEDEVERACTVFSMGLAEVARLIAEDKERQGQSDAIDADFEEPALEDDPFGDVP